MIFRTDAQKKDQVLNWKRGDKAFFASGACHILAHVFLQEYGTKGFCPWLVVPGGGFRGSHVFAATEDVVFDYHGFSIRRRFEEHYFRKMKRLFPGWTATIVEAREFMTPVFLREFNCRAPDQYWADPRPRAEEFIRRKMKFRRD